MGIDLRLAFRYEPTWCSLLGKHVWAIRARQPDGTWRIVNRLDKDEGCFGLTCTFTTERGEWPYVVGASHADDAMT